MKVKRLELIEALKFVEKDIVQHVTGAVSSRSKDESFVIYTHFGKRYTIDCDAIQEQFIPIGKAIPKLLRLLPTLDCEYITLNYDGAKVLYISATKDVVHLSAVKDKDGNEIKDKDGKVIRRRVLGESCNTSEIEVGNWESAIDFYDSADKGNFIVQLDIDKIETMKKAKQFLSSNEYTPTLCNFFVSDSVLYASDAMSIYSNRFNCTDISLPSFLASDSFIDCRVYKNNNDKMFVVGKNWEMRLDSMEYPAQHIINTVKELRSNTKENSKSYRIELCTQRLRIACNVSKFADSNAQRLILNLNTVESNNDVALEVLGNDLTAVIPTSDSYSEIDIFSMVASKIILQALNTLQLPKNDLLRCLFVTVNDKGFCLYIKQKEEVIILMLQKPDNKEIAEERDRLLPEKRIERFESSGWSTFDEFAYNDYKTKDQVELERLIQCKINDYDNQLKELVPINIDRVQSAQNAKKELDILVLQLDSIKQAHKEAFVLSEDGQQLILLRSELNGLKKLQVSDDNTERIELLKSSIKEIEVEYKNSLYAKTKTIELEKNHCLRITIEDALLLELNIDHVANSNSHILTKREAIQKEYDEFLLNPAKYVRTTKQVGEELKEKKGKKRELETV